MIPKIEYDFLMKIKDACNEYLNKKISFIYFQKLIEAYFSNWENEISKNSYIKINDFIGKIEIDYFMYDEPKRQIKIKENIKNLLDYIESVQIKT